MSEESAYRELANAIVVQAVDDWRKLCKRQEPNYKFTEIRQFSKVTGAPYCAVMLTRCLYWTHWNANARQLLTKFREDYINGR